MNHFVDPQEWTGPPLELFGADHRRMLTLIVLLEVLLLNRARAADPATRRRLRRLLASGLVAQEVSLHAWRAATRTWTATEMLPLHLCSASVWLGALMLWTRSQRLYDLLYYAAPVGAGLALAAPDVGALGAPHYRFWQFFASHGLILTAPLWMTFAEGLRPGPHALRRATAGTAAFAGSVFLANRRLGSNYMFLNGKPATASPLDALPPWPRYLPLMAAGVAALFGALDAPWALADAHGGGPGAARPRGGRGQPAG